VWQDDRYYFSAAAILHAHLHPCFSECDQVAASRSNSQTTTRPITTVSITKDIRFYFEKTPIELAQLESLLRQKIGKSEDPTIAIHAEKSVPIEYIVEVMNIAKRNNYKVILATSPEFKR